MDTKVFYIDEHNMDMETMRYASRVIKDGGTVVFPTETVYGLGANALDECAARKIFAAKGRPQDNPLIIHVCSTDIGQFVKDIPHGAAELMNVFWPGPLTIILKKSDIIPDVITAGLDSVAIRMPSNVIAHELIKLAGVPVAAPSANLSGRPSPTDVTHVIEDLSGRVDVILGGGRTDVGLESTVIDMTGRPVILRPGGITFEQIKKVLDDVYVDPAIMKKTDSDFKPRSPGMKYRHYAPKASMYIVRGNTEDMVSAINQITYSSLMEGKKVGILATKQTADAYKQGTVLIMGDREHPETIAASIFDRLREFDSIGVDVIYTEAVDESDIGLAIMNRMMKAAGYNVIDV